LHRFISYDDPESIAAKAAYVKAQRLGGIMYWEQSQDPTRELLDAVWRGLQ
jgi:chitinase